MNKITSKSDFWKKMDLCPFRNDWFNYDDVKVLETEINYKKRSFLEMYHIHQTMDTMNKRTDLEGLSSIYTYVLSLNAKKQNIGDSMYEEAITF